MADHVTVSTAKARLLALIDAVEQGEEFELTRHGRVVARLVPARGARTLRGVLDGQAISAASDEDLFGTGEAWELT
ncbi:MAG: type II toxin-antitoxin system prevent-host-death family antitoxin [Candidatus Limnocylindrales bacterium]